LTVAPWETIIICCSIDKEASLPLYEYECKKCGRRTEKIRKFSDPPLTVCETCGGELDQLLSSPAIQFKGSGWYVTDYAKKSSAPTSSSSGDSPSSTENKEKDSGKDTGTDKGKESSNPSEPAPTSASKDNKAGKESKASKD
jgi:putative FmdB family regulatory protein